ncbi:glycogen synthase kinase 3 beta [Nematocida displodere]|uniref:Glycogen synthase kinase 3 beta n=1 Tax=Nematocida displodere TaxID=1805483 RepID=A0A177EIX2_9MICR|nr:glycogen synthase kinase 3 beta [Nematocida displodere]
MDSIKASAVCAITGGVKEIEIFKTRKIGQGSFGEVFHIEVAGVGYAMKMVFERDDYINRELVMLQRFRHESIVSLQWYFYGERRGNGVFLNIGMEYIRQDLLALINQKYVFTRQELAVYGSKLLDGVAYLHGLNVAHRDIKPSNLLIDERLEVLKLCDLGSAKEMRPGDKSVTYICSRNYRAPEVCSGAAYTTKLDIWSSACVIAEMIIGGPLFRSSTSDVHLKNILEKTPKIPDYLLRKAKERNITDMVNILVDMFKICPDKRIGAREARDRFRACLE